ncbi:nucleolar complex protein 2 homolog isoform X2 [Ylistrum balloti]|uniref:nucleolar complex protein 2 homolog isoform X1 n=1 Tax=Ylistrum balloti TaxID=509963 RepID=UPI002905E3BB|nr:nucleolar complex protein 2 homolog isoform X1 [Ylistrum balloti]XP_060066446.1 nucleolar complex protein 2 homolog isoform X2 [Ylistrum balloti]
MAAHMAKSMAPKKRKLKDMSVDEFMKSAIDSDSSDGSSEPEISKKKKTAKSKKPDKKAASKHKKSLENLEKLDPEFYKFLENEDKSLLDFGDDDEEDDENEEEESDEDEDSDEADKSSFKEDVKEKASGKKSKFKLDLEDLDDYSTDEDEEDSSDEDSGKGRFHKLPKKLEVASDDSEEETDGDEEDKDEKENTNTVLTKKKQKGTLLTPRLIKNWSKSLETKPTMAVLKEVIAALKAAVLQAGGEGKTNKYVVKGSAVFNAIVRMCLTQVAPALHQVIGLPPITDLQKPIVPASNNKKWVKIRVDVKTYVTYLLKLVSELSEPTMVNVILKHIHKLVAFYSCFPKIAKVMLKQMISLWSTGEDTTRVMAFFCINRLVRIMQTTLLDACIKQMYIAYVKNCKFTSPSTLPMINFMQRSMVEIFAIDIVHAYQYTFVYIRQLAIHLRNAITTKKQESCQAVYNWQFVHSLGLWVRLLSATHPNPVLEPLIYPLTQTIIGTIKLLPNSRFYPLRFHCVRLMTTLSQATMTFIPVLPFLLEIFEQIDFNKQYKNPSFKPFNFACILKLSKSQLVEKSFKDGVIDQLYELLLDQLHVHQSSVGFPELALPAILQLKAFLKKCKVANYCKQIRQILDKVEENSKFITNRRKSFNVNLADTKTIEAWEKKCEEAGTPLGKYYKTWRKLRDRELQHEISAKEQVLDVDDGIPLIVRPKGPQKATAEDKMDFAALFDKESDESDDEMRFLPKSERTTKSKKTDSDSDDYSDFDSDELEQLAQSADEDDEDSEEEEDDEEEEEAEADDANASNDDEDIPDVDDVVEDFTMSDSD